MLTPKLSKTRIFHSLTSIWSGNRSVTRCAPSRDFIEHTFITLKDFQKLMFKRKRTVDDLVDIFRGTLDDSRAFFERAMTCQWRNPETGRYDDRGDVVIPYRSVIEFYRKEEAYLKDTEQEQAVQAEKRKRGPMSEDRKQALLKQLEKARASKVRQTPKLSPSVPENIEEVIR